MPKTFLQGFFFTVLMAFLMVYAMICYNIAFDKGGMSNEIFFIAFHELLIMWPIAIILEMFVVEKLSGMLTARVVTHDMAPLFVILIRCSFIVCLMCPIMSFIATLLFQQPGNEIIAAWLQTTVRNFPMALCWQIFFAGPFGRLVFRSVMNLISKDDEAILPEAE